MKKSLTRPTLTLLFCSTGCVYLHGAGNHQAKAKKRSPNILIAISDDQSFAHTSFVGARFVSTPGFDKVAKEGVYFQNCFAGSPGSAPSRSALVTGRHHWQNESSGQHAAPWLKKIVPMVDIFRQAGYHVGITGKGVAPFQYARNENDSLWREENAAGPEYNRVQYKKGSPEDVRTAGLIGTCNYFENFKAFMEEREADKPFYFWYGSTEPHRDYEKGSWKRNGKRLEDVGQVPGFLPDCDEIRGDILDYAVEIEWFDRHLCKMLDYLESVGELDNTIVIVTADNGMPFPGAKANCFEYGAHVPLAVRYPAGVNGGRSVSDPIGFADIAPTLLEMTGVSPKGMLPMSGRSVANILRSDKEGRVDQSKKFAFSGRERHSSSRWNNMGFPVRAVRSDAYVYIWNLLPMLWPAGDPQALDKNGNLHPLHGVDSKGVHHSEWAYADVDASPSKSYIAEHHNDPKVKPFFDIVFGKRPEFELYHVGNDPYCLENLSGNPTYKNVEESLKKALTDELIRTKDPRMVGPVKDVFEKYPRFSRIRNFPKTEEYEGF